MMMMMFILGCRGLAIDGAYGGRPPDSMRVWQTSRGPLNLLVGLSDLAISQLSTLGLVVVQHHSLMQMIGLICQ